MDKYVIKVNGVVYQSYKDFCEDWNIDHKEFMKVKISNPYMSEMDLLNMFFDRVGIRMNDGSYIVNDKETTDKSEYFQMNHKKMSK